MTIVSISIANNRGIINVRGVINVKNTMISRLLQYVAPDYCCGCGFTGSLLCDSCIKDIVFEPFLWCLSCASQAPASDGLCAGCKNGDYSRAWVAGIHEGVLDKVIDSYKFNASRDGVRPLAQLICEVIPELPPETVLIPVPTALPHVRQRGFDHTRLLAQHIARLKGVSMNTGLLRRKTNAVQREASATVRRKQAKEMFFVREKVNSDNIYLLIDDVMTTGSTITYAAKTLRQAGAKQVWVAVIARQMLS